MDNNFARAMAALTTGIYVLTTQENGRCHGMSSSWVAQVSGEPVMFTAAVDTAFSNAVITRTGLIRLNVGRPPRAEDYFTRRARRDNNLDTIEFEPSPRCAMAETRDGRDRSLAWIDATSRAITQYRSAPVGALGNDGR
jgi:hypothetical protein